MRLTFKWTSLVAQTVKRLPTTRETCVQSLGREDPLEKEMATHSSTLAWKTLLTEEPGALCFIGSQRVKVKVAQSCPTLCNPMDYTVHGVLQARTLVWVAFPFFRESSQPRSPTLQADSLPTELCMLPIFTQSRTCQQ